MANKPNSPKPSAPKHTPPVPKNVPPKPAQDNRANQINPNHQPTKGNDNPLKRD